MHFKSAQDAKAFDQKLHAAIGNNLHLMPAIVAAAEREAIEDAEDLRIYRGGKMVIA